MRIAGSGIGERVGEAGSPPSSPLLEDILELSAASSRHSAETSVFAQQTLRSRVLPSPTRYSKPLALPKDESVSCLLCVVFLFSATTSISHSFFCARLNTLMLYSLSPLVQS